MYVLALTSSRKAQLCKASGVRPRFGRRCEVGMYDGLTMLSDMHIYIYICMLNIRAIRRIYRHIYLCAVCTAIRHPSTSISVCCMHCHQTCISTLYLYAAYTCYQTYLSTSTCVCCMYGLSDICRYIYVGLLHILAIRHVYLHLYLYAAYTCYQTYLSTSTCVCCIYVVSDLSFYIYICIYVLSDISVYIYICMLHKRAIIAICLHLYLYAVHTWYQTYLSTSTCVCCI